MVDTADFNDRIERSACLWAELVGRVHASGDEAKACHLQRAVNTAAIKCGYEDLIDRDVLPPIPAVTEADLARFRRGLADLTPGDFGNAL